MSNYRFASWPEHNGKKVVLDDDVRLTIYRNAAVATNLRPKMWTNSVASDGTGGATISIPAGYFTTVNYVSVSCMRDTAAPAFGTFAMLRSFTTTQIVVQCFESKTTNTLLLSQAEGLELATSALIVMALAVGVGP